MKESRRIYIKKYLVENKERIKATQRICYEKNPEKYKKMKKVYYENNKAKYKAEAKVRYENNKDKIIASVRAYQSKNKESRNSKAKERRNNDPQISISHRLRNRLNHAIRASNTSKCLSAFKLIGVPILDFMQHIESLFLAGMNWSNRNEWHLDHIKPCAAFDLTDTEQQKECFHYSNFQPLWRKDNISKGSSFEGKRHTYIKAA